MRVEAEPADGWLPRGIAAQPDAPESAAVRHHQLAAVVEDELELGEARRPCAVGLLAARLELHPRTAGGRVETARHAEVKAGPGPAVQLEPEMLAVALHGLHATADERPTESRGRHPLEHNGVVGAARLDDTAAARHLQGDAPAALDLRELRHPDEHTVGTIGVRSYITTLPFDEGFPAESPWWPHTSTVSTHGRSGGTLPRSSQSDPGAECHNVRPDPHSGREEVCTRGALSVLGRGVVHHGLGSRGRRRAGDPALVVKRPERGAPPTNEAGQTMTRFRCRDPMATAAERAGGAAPATGRRRARSSPWPPRGR